MKRVIHITNNNSYCLSPNSLNIKKLMNKNYNINNSDSQRKSAYYMYASNRLNDNSYINNFGNKIFYRKVQKGNIIINRKNNINNSNTINYNTENNEFGKNKKFVL